MSDHTSTSDHFSEGRIRDVRALKAFAHPLRMQIFEYLSDHSAATSATLARELGESTGQTSYHLRQLAKFGFVREVEGKGTARERWWKHVGMTIASEDAQELARQSPLVQTIAQRNAAERAERVQEFHSRIPHEEPEWVDAAAMSTHSAMLTPSEAKALRTELWDAVKSHLESAAERRETDPQTARRWSRVHIDLFPLPSGHEGNHNAE